MEDKNIPQPQCNTCKNCIQIINLHPEGQVMRTCKLMPLGMPLLQINEGAAIPNVKICSAYIPKDQVW